MGSHIGIGLLVTLGVLVVAYNLWAHARFDTFCREVAAEKGEQAELDDPRGGSDGSYNGYRLRIHAELLEGIVDPNLSEPLKERAKLLSHTVAMARDISVLYVGLLIVLGLVLHW